MIPRSIERLKYIIENSPSQIRAIDDFHFSSKKDSFTWSKKEILGHLIDSATNNHHRFIRAQYEEAPVIWYDQNNWVEKSNYEEIDTEQLIQFWYFYNKHIIYIIENIQPDKLQNICIMKDGSRLTIEYLITDYVDHLEHHLKQIFGEL